MIFDSWKTLLLIVLIIIYQIILIKWGVEILRSGNKETLATDFTKKPPCSERAVFLCLLIVLVPNFIFLISNNENHLKD